jgi:hypothetical protein
VDQQCCDPERSFTDPDPTFQLVSDPDLTFQLVSDPDLVSDPTFSNILNINFTFVFLSCTVCVLGCIRDISL